VTNIYKIAVIPGDNVGPEVIAEGVKVLKAAASLCNVGLEMTELPWGSNHYLATGDYMAPDGMKILQDFDAIYLGAMGDPARVPSQVTAAGHNQKIKKGMDLYVNMRPTRLLSGCPTPLKDPGEVDFVIVRENTEGEYAAAGGRVHMGTDNEVAGYNVPLLRHYLVANAHLQMGQILYQVGDRERSIYHYKEAMRYNGEYYRASIRNEAKTGLSLID